MTKAFNTSYCQNMIIWDSLENMCAPPIQAYMEEFASYIDAPNIRFLNLDDPDTIGYTFKCMGAGFWALRQDNFRDALEAIVFEGGDADTNGAVAGALLGCKLGMEGLPTSWLNGLFYKNWLNDIIKE